MKEKSREIASLYDLNKTSLHLFEAKLFSEMFYYKGFRLRNIIRYSGGLGKAFECVGIRNVRNLLIEHPEKSDLVYIHSFALGIAEIGPVLKSGKPQNDIKFKDSGLVKNALEFKNNFENLLTDFLNK
tara:strand:+ start:602 stop:985 length:384 start_codon:yes stop_codon:yes gene_type:complete